MARNRFREIMKLLRFDKKETRRVRLQDDKFALVSHIWNKLVQNSVACYKPGANITIDEQLFPPKALCTFIQYKGNKPDKFAIKFWLAEDVNSKYMLNRAPYLLHIITTDNFFASLKLATTLQAKKTSLVGTLGKRRELPPPQKEQAELFSNKVLKCADATLTIYQGKPRKNVCILSSVHTSVGITDGPKAKPESVTYYNNTKYGVDVLDQMAKAYSVKGGTRRWPVAVFYNILDLTGINAHILFKECTSSKIARRKFMQQLAEELRAESSWRERGQHGSWHKVPVSSRSNHHSRHQNGSSARKINTRLKKLWRIGADRAPPLVEESPSQTLLPPRPLRKTVKGGLFGGTDCSVQQWYVPRIKKGVQKHPWEMDSAPAHCRAKPPPHMAQPLLQQQLEV
ncbi:uncharacterized protein LOC122880764 [Siniperca chuatsi]|uniref:uncharacterized protein LOC122880764 n=1 Tax=Siniperca chuatsi TaxID=119488 RepID=UPI001CE05D2E|nr:uncharacterized protein LOC122880764 [Siniperca chuatsi]